MVKRSWRSLLAGAVLTAGFAVASPAFAGDGCGSACATGPSCQDCEKIFADAGQKLTDQLAAMSCCPESSCCAPSSICSDVCGDPGCGDGCGELFGDSGHGITFGGWVQFGYHNKVTPLSVNRNDGLAFNDHPNRFNLHQGWVYAEKVADGSNGLDWGFRADFLYGVDAAQTQAFGNRPGKWDFQNGWDRGAGYGFAMPQLYGEVAMGDVSVKAGHFYTLIGYEVVPATGNFFYSHAYTMFNSEPFTHTGAIATYKASDNLTLYGGWTLGWDTAFDQNNGGNNFMGGFSSGLTDDITLTYINTAGNFGWRGEGYSHSIVLDTALTDDLNHVIQSDVVRADEFDTIGINNYLFYTINDKLKAGTRVEWWKADGISAYEATFGVNVTPMDSLMVRPEIRYDWGRDPNTALEQNQTTFGIDVIYTF